MLVYNENIMNSQYQKEYFQNGVWHSQIVGR